MARFIVRAIRNGINNDNNDNKINNLCPANDFVRNFGAVLGARSKVGVDAIVAMYEVVYLVLRCWSDSWETTAGK